MNKTKVAKIKLLNEVDAVIIGLRPSEYAAISDEFALNAYNYFFHPKFKAKKWDGKIRYFYKNGKTYINLLPEIVPILTDLDYKIEIIDKRDNVKINIPIIDENYVRDVNDSGIVLEPHQLKIINSLTQNNGGIIKAGTGAGKTICAWVLHDLYYKHCGFETLVIVPTADLIHQTVEEFKLFSDDVGCWGDKKKDLNHPVVVSTWQTLKEHPSFIIKFKHIILDECHGGKKDDGKVSEILNEHAKDCYVKMGMTGTLPPHPSHMRTLQCSLGDVLFEITAKELIDAGWLAKMNLTMLRLKEDFREEYEKFKAENIEHEKITYAKYKKALFPEFSHERDYYVNSNVRNEYISNFVQKILCSDDKQNAVILVNTIKQGKALERLIPGSTFIYGKDKTKVRKQMFNLFSEKNDVKLITTFGLAAIGLNIKRIFYVFMIDAGQSFIRVIQTLGRGLRKAEDKKLVNIFDIFGNLYYGTRHENERTKFYKEEDHEFEKIAVNYRERNANI